MTLGSHQQSIGKSQAHFTPREQILDRLGKFELDPCAGDPRPWDCARVNYTEADDGLSKPWFGRVWCNPPFDRRVVGLWVERMAEHDHGILLLHVRPETATFRPVWRRASGILFLDRRLIFCKADGSPQTISNPKAKHFGKAANSGAPVALISFGEEDLVCLRRCGIPGALVTDWQILEAPRPALEGLLAAE
jgi:hypothetical protein